MNFFSSSWDKIEKKILIFNKNNIELRYKISLICGLILLGLIGTVNAAVTNDDGSMCLSAIAYNDIEDSHECMTEYYGGYTCGAVGCHPQEASDMLSSTHYTWRNPYSGMGKINTQNSYCTNPSATTMFSGFPIGGTGGEPWDGLELGGGCVICHTGFGLIKMADIGTGSWKYPSLNGFSEILNIDCLICHAPSGYSRLTKFMGDEDNPTGTQGLPGDFANNPDSCIYRPNTGDDDLNNDCYDGVTFHLCLGTEEICIYDPVDLGQITMDDRIVLWDERLTSTIPVFQGFDDDFFSLIGKDGLGVNIPGIGPRIVSSDLIANPQLTPQSGSLGPLPMNNQVAISAAKLVKDKVQPESCLRCHTGSGGGKNSKRGDIEMEPILSGATEEHDIHLAYGLACFQCHIPTNHQFPGTGLDIPGGSESFKCEACHYDHLNVVNDQHRDFIACQTCHVTRIAKVEDTELLREWMNSGVEYGDTGIVLDNPLGTLGCGGPILDNRTQSPNGIWHPGLIRKSNVNPRTGIEYIWWNGSTKHVLPEDDIIVDDQELIMNQPLGNIGNGKIYPIKRHSTEMIVHNNKMTMISVDSVFQGYGIENALRIGSWRSGRDPDGSLISALVMYDYYFGLFEPIEACNMLNSIVEPMVVGIQKASRMAILNHEVGPKENALGCRDCHGLDGILDWNALGYLSLPCDNDGDGYSNTNCKGPDTFDSDPSLPVPNTPLGSNVVVYQSFGRLIFDNVNTGGLTIIESILEDEIPSPPSNFILSGNQFYISSSSEYSGNIQVCLTYDDSGIADENNLKLMHHDFVTWYDVTTSLDTDINEICGSVTSLSPFAVMEDVGTPITWYFAEGYTGTNFYERLVLPNPAQTSANVDITYMFDDATTQSQSLAILPGRRTTVDVNSIIGPNKAVSIKVDASQAVVAERPMLFKYGGNIPGAHSTQAVIALSTVWYFAEGYTGSGFYEYLTLQNPNGSPVDVDVTYMFDDGSTQLQQVTISANTRYTVNVNSIVGAGKAVSIKVTSAQPIIAERPMYFNYAGSIPGGHVTVGATELSTIWYFAEGWTGSGFYEYLTLMNPNDVSVDITVTYMFDDGTTQTSSFPMLAHQRYTVNVNIAVGANKAVSIKVESTVGIVAERPMYFNYAGTTKGGHDTIGGTTPHNIWYFADGETNSGTDMYVTIMNPDTVNTASITVTYMFADGTSQQEVISVLPTQRYTINVNNQVGSGKEVAVKLDSDVPIFAERPMYYNNWNGLGIDGGTVALGFAP